MADLDDGGQYLICRAENHELPASIIEDTLRLDVQCKFISGYLSWKTNSSSSDGIYSVKLICFNTPTPSLPPPYIASTYCANQIDDAFTFSSSRSFLISLFDNIFN